MWKLKLHSLVVLNNFILLLQVVFELGRFKPLNGFSVFWPENQYHVTHSLQNLHKGCFIICTSYKFQISSFYLNPICTWRERICPPPSYFNRASKLKKRFALMHPDFESNLITHIFRKFGVSETTGSDVIFAFV